MTRHRDPRTVTPRYPLDPWQVRETRFDPDVSREAESLFALGNGYIGIRGTLEEGAPAGVVTVPGTYLNGFHEREEIAYPEPAYGYARWRQTMLNVTGCTNLALRLDGEPLQMGTERVSAYERVLDLRAGTLTRTLTWTAFDGARTRLTFVRAVSLAHRARVAQRLTVAPLDRAVRVEVTHALDGTVENQVETGDPRIGTALKGQVLAPVAHRHQGARRALRQRARGSGMELVCACEHHAHGADVTTEVASEPSRAELRLVAGPDASEAFRLDLHAVYADARDHAPEALDAAADAELDAFARDGGVDGLLAAQRAWLNEYWTGADVEVAGDAGVQQSVRFSLYHLAQGAGRDGRTNIPSKALTGEGYEGHTFWDTEIYVLPVFLHVRPDIARALLQHRIHLLDAARARATELHHDGALYPWRTIAGPEASAFFPAGTAQYHIDADVVHAFERYLAATGDGTIMWAGGAAVAVECARFFLSAGAWGQGGAFHLHTVTGPDEYTALVDDQHYTNRMMQGTFRFAAQVVEDLAAEDPARFEAVRQGLGLGADEPDAWRRAADAVHLPVDPGSGVTPQDATFLTKPEWPWDEVPAERYPLLLHYHPLDIYRHQVLKQADVLLAHHLRPSGVSRTQLRRDAAYYAPRTTHDSSLSACVHAIIAARLGRAGEALDFFARTARMDLDDLNGNVKDGVHAAAMAGTWLAVTEGFGGLDVQGGTPCFHPRLPAGWTRLRVRVAWHGRVIEVDTDAEVTRYRLRRGEALEVRHRGEALRLEPDGEAVLPSGPRLRGVALDLDGVVTDSAAYHDQAWKALADELDIPFDETANQALRGLPRMDSLEAILARGQRALPEEEKQRLAARKNAHYQRLIEDVTPRDLLPGIPELLVELGQAGVRIVLASSSRNAPALVRRLGIEDRLDAIVDPAAVHAGKPDPEIFERAAEALGLSPEDCVGVEDAAAGVASIEGAGMPSVGVGDVAHLGDATRVVPDTRALTMDVLREAVGA
ncbi:MAG: beta-phosphoglucomutase [Trueperaceae bacterium]|nr:beta-phosphoglucomutase [Trueperaceae bacterium]